MPYINTYSIPKPVLEKRINALDNDAVVWLSSGFDDATQTTQQIINTDSSLDVTLINNTIQQPITQSEIDWMNERQQIKNAYQTMLTRLQQIQNAGAIPFTQAGFNQVVQAVKDEALYIEWIMKAISKI